MISNIGRQAVQAGRYAVQAGKQAAQSGKQKIENIKKEDVSHVAKVAGIFTTGGAALAIEIAVLSDYSDKNGISKPDFIHL